MNNTPYIGFFKRAVAFIIDSIVAAIPPALLCGPMLFWLGNTAEPEPGSEAAMVTMATIMAVYFLWQILGLVSYWLYFACCESGTHQATWGKRLLGMKVVGINGERIGFGRATGRLFAKFLSYATLYIGFLMAGNTSRKRALHDYIAQTYVVSKDFQPGDELPETKSHMVRLGVIIAVMLMIGGLGLLSLIGSSTPVRAKAAAQRLQQLALEKNPLHDALQENGVTYSRNRDGYRAQFEDMEAETYTLLFQPQTGNLCCEEFPGESCRETRIPQCN